MPFHRSLRANNKDNAPHPNLTPESLSLLLHTPPTFVALARHSSWRSPPRHLQLRANVILLLRHNHHISTAPIDALSVSSIDRLHVLSPTHRPFITAASPSNKKSSPSTTVTIGVETYAFPDATSAALFRDAVLCALSAHASAPAYIVTGAAPFQNNDDEETIGRYVMARISGNVDNKNDMVVVKTFDKALLRGRKGKDEIRSIVIERIALQKVVTSMRKSPFLPRTLHAFETATQLAMVTDVIAPLGNVKTLMRRLPGRRLPIHICRLLFSELVLAIADMHAAGVVYGRVRPDCMLLTASGHVRIYDFSYATYMHANGGVKKSVEIGDKSEMGMRVFGNESESDMTSTIFQKAMDHNVAYMAPEVLNGKRTCSTKTDVWSLGATLYEMVTGRKPFGVCGDVNEMRHRMENRRIKVPDFVDYELRMLLSSLLSRDEIRRPTLSQVRGTGWLRSVDWTKIRVKAERGFMTDSIVRFAAGVGIREDSGNDMGMSSGVIDVEVFDDETVDGDRDGVDGGNEWSRMTREFCRVDGVENGSGGRGMGMKKGKKKRRRRRRWWDVGTVLTTKYGGAYDDDFALEDESGQLLGFGLKVPLE